MSHSFLLAISRRRLWNLCCHSAQCARMATLMGEQSRRTNSLFTSVSSFCTLLAISKYLEVGGGREGRGGGGEERGVGRKEGNGERREGRGGNKEMQ